MKQFTMLCALVFSFALSACGGTPAKPDAGAVSFTINGSTTVFPVVRAAATAYMAANPNVTITVTETDSGSGVTAAGTGTADIGMASRDLKAAELTMYPDLKSVSIARDGIVVVTHPSNTITVLTTDQVKAIYLGTTTLWTDVGGASGTIASYRREDGSGTGDFFNSTILGGTTTPVAAVTPKQGNEGVKAAVAADVNGIGYLGFSYLDATVKGLDLKAGGVTHTATKATILDGTYPISRNLNLITKGDAAGAPKAFIDYLLSAPGQALVTSNGFVSIR